MAQPGSLTFEIACTHLHVALRGYQVRLIADAHLSSGRGTGRHLRVRCQREQNVNFRLPPTAMT